MTRPTRSNARTRALAVLTAAATIAGGAALLGPGTSLASSHREAPYTSSDPTIDATDLYAFNSPDGSDTTTLIANYIPFEDPAGGPNFFPFATDARYNINIDNNGDGVADTTFRWTFTNQDTRGTADHGDTGKGTFLYNDGPVTSLDDANLLFKQSYKLEQITNPTSATPTAVTILDNVPVPPDNVGTASIPDYIPLSKAAVEAGKVGAGPFAGVQAFAGQRNDPFFLDLRIFDLLYGGNLSETGFNSIKDKNVKTIAIKVPKALLAGAGDVKANPVVGVWTTSERHGTRTLQATNTAPGAPAVSSDNSANDWVQVSRLGNPLVNEAVVPANLKDSFNRLTPDIDHTLKPIADKVTDPEVPHLVESIYKIPNPNGTPKGAGRPDLVAAFLTGIDGLNNPKTMNANGSNATLAEELRLNLTTAPTAKPNPLGAVGGDTQGFPNGRRLSDDVVDIALQVLEGVLVPDQDPAVKAAVKGLGDGVSQEDQLLADFPYVAEPLAGSDNPVGTIPVRFQQNFTSSGGYVTTSVSRITPATPGGFVQLYRINADGSSTGLGSMTLDKTGTTSTTKRFFVGSGKKITLNYRVFPQRGSASEFNRGVATTITVK
jgi:hypothetical protein